MRILLADDNYIIVLYLDKVQPELNLLREGSEGNHHTPKQDQKSIDLSSGK